MNTPRRRVARAPIGAPSSRRPTSAPPPSRQAVQTTLPLVTLADRTEADDEIRTRQKDIKYDLRDFTVDYLVEQFNNDFFYIPPYQREFVWNQEKQSRFIESLILGLPIPMMFVADALDGRFEVVDGAQRLQTLEAFLSDDLQLAKLEHLPSINGFRFTDMPTSQQRRLKGRALRLVVLEESTDLELRQEIFNRINTSSERARGSEIRRGTYQGSFMDFIISCARMPLFKSLCPMSDALRKRREDEELVLRFFAYSERYASFKHDVDSFLDKFVKDHRHTFDRERYAREFRAMLDFVNTHFRNCGFSKKPHSASTPRVRFEAISVGVNLALRAKPGLVIPLGSFDWLDSDEFQRHTTTHASNSLSRLAGRIEYVRDQLLAASEE